MGLTQEAYTKYVLYYHSLMSYGIQWQELGMNIQNKCLTYHCTSVLYFFVICVFFVVF